MGDREFPVNNFSTATQKNEQKNTIYNDDFYTAGLLLLVVFFSGVGLCFAGLFNSFSMSHLCHCRRSGIEY